jgi:hypothetical protein
MFFGFVHFRLCAVDGNGWFFLEVRWKVFYRMTQKMPHEKAKNFDWSPVV